MGYHMAVTDLHEGGSLEELATLPDEGITSYKLFMAYKGALMVDDETLFRTMEVASQTGALVMVHAENGDLIDVLVRQALEAGNTEPLYHALTRPPEAEGEATNRAIQLAHVAGAPLYVVHVTCREAVEPIARASEAGWDVWGETCTQYFFNSLDDIAKPNFEGAKYVYSPPVRDKSNWDVLWNAVRTDALSAISTDHCAFLLDGQKTLGKDDFSKIPNGGPGLENRLHMIHEFGARAGRISLNRMVELLATSPAKLFGLYPKKGTVAVGSDADLVDLRPRAQAHDHGRDPALEDGLQPLRGHRGDRHARGRAAPRERARRERRARRLAGHRALRAPRPLRPGAAAEERRRVDGVGSDGRLGVVLDVAPHLAGALRRVQTRDEVERHVDPGRDAGGRDHVAVVHEAVVRPHLDLAAQRRQQLERAASASSPACRRAARPRRARASRCRHWRRPCRPPARPRIQSSTASSASSCRVPRPPG